MSKDAFKLLNGDNKELYIIPDAVHTDLYDGGNKDYIPFDKFESFFKEYDKDCRGELKEFHCRQIQDVLKDVYGGIKYERRSVSDAVTVNRADNREQDS